ncbi:MAG: hypothetical protein GX811_11350 [Lentisphaerae bacterium]|nr:hypothetical protein [Lentisphaerota bacterium]
MKIMKSKYAIYTFLLLFALASYTFAADRNWSGSVSGDWHDPLNWTESSIPEANDNVIIDGASEHQPVLDLSDGPVTIASLSIGASKASTLTFSYGDVATKRLIVTGDVYVGPNGTLTHAVNDDEETHRLFLDVGGDMEIANKGFINTEKKAYFNTGPDSKARMIGRSHGGHGGYVANVYGSITHPVSIGSSYNANGGGGAIRLLVGGTLLINGTITSSSSGWGSGGSILIDADTIAGITGTIKVNGSHSGSGGRIALYYNSKTYTGNLTTHGSTYLSVSTGAGGTIFEKNKNENHGKLWVSNSVTSQNLTYLVNPNIDGETLHLKSITAYDRARIFVGVNITADNYITEGTGIIKRWSDPDMLGSEPDTYWIGTADTNWNNGSNWSSGTVPRPDDAVVVEGGENYLINLPYLFIEDTNAEVKSLGVGNSMLRINCPFDEENNWRLILSEDLILAPGGLIAHNTNIGSAEQFRINLEAKNMNVAFSGGVELSQIGRTSGGPGGGKHTSSYGGQSPLVAITYGSITWPINLGSAYIPPGSGGAAKLNIAGLAIIDGFMKSDGRWASGGSILLLCDTFSGSGEITAGSGHGSGGRIAIYYREKTFTGSISAYGSSYNAGNAAGTIYEKPDHLEHGILIISNEVVNTSIFTSLNDLEAVNYTFDEILVSGTGRLLVGGDDSLTLPENGHLIIEEHNWASVTVAENGIFNNAGTIELPGKENSLNIVGNLNNFPGSLVLYTGVTADEQDSYVANGFDYYNLEIDAPGKSFLWNAGETYNIHGQLTIAGEPDNRVVLRSTTDEEQWFLDLTGVPGYAEHVDVQDSNANLGKYVLVGPKENQGWLSSVDSGNNNKWFFGLYKGTIFKFY